MPAIRTLSRPEAPALALAVAMTSLLLACGGGGGGGTAPGPLPSLAVSNRSIVSLPGGGQVILRGVTLTSGVWFFDPTNPAAGLLPDLQFMQGEDDFARIHGWGANVVTLYLDWHWFETASDPGWAWMDGTLTWARKHQLYVVPSMVVYPVGGLRGGSAFWASQEAQDQLAAFWSAFAERYQGVPELAGLDVTNEPQGADAATIAAYQTELVDAVRGKDPERIVFIEPQWGRAQALTTVDRDGLVYDVHQYEPYAFTSQGWPWMWGGGVPTGQGWPGEFVMALEQVGSPSGATVSAGTAGWTQTSVTGLTPPSGAQYAFPRFFSNEDAAATVWFDDLQVRVNRTGTIPIWQDVPNGGFETKNEFTADASLWMPYAAAAGSVARASDDHAGGGWSMRFQGCAGWCEAALWQPGSLATLGGITVRDGDTLDFRFSVRTQGASTGKDGFQVVWVKATTEAWDRSRLRASYDDLVGSFSAAHGVPMFVGEFTPSLIGPRPGIVSYLGDTLDWLDENGVSWTYYEYRDTYAGSKYMGIYNGAYGTTTSGCTEDADILSALRAHL